MKPQLIFPSKFESIFNIITHSSCLAQTLYCILTVKNGLSKCKFSDFGVLGQNSPNSLCQFSKHKAVSLQILPHLPVLWHITLLYFFGSNIIYFRQKLHIKVQIFRLATTHIKMHKIPNVIFWNQESVFLQAFESLFSVLRHNSSVLFYLNLYMHWIKGANQSANFQTFDYSHEN